MAEDDNVKAREDGGGVVVFDPNLFRKLKPEFADLSDEVLGYAFDAAEIYLMETRFANVSDSRVPYKIRQAILYALTCHYLTLGRLSSTTSGLAMTPSSVSEGSVSVGLSAMTASTTQRPIGDLDQTVCGKYAAELMRIHGGPSKARLIRAWPRPCAKWRYRP